MIEGLRYKVRMMGIPVNGSTSVFCDESVLAKNSMAPESMLKKCPMLLPIIKQGRLRQQVSFELPGERGHADWQSTDEVDARA
jgi:hypothetical protein